LNGKVTGTKILSGKYPMREPARRWKTGINSFPQHAISRRNYFSLDALAVLVELLRLQLEMFWIEN